MTRINPRILALACLLPVPPLHAQSALEQLRALAPDSASTVAVPAARAARIEPNDPAVVSDPLNLTAQYTAAWDDPDRAFPPERVAELKGCKVIFVPGFMANVYIVLGSRPLARRFQQAGYFDEQMAWLDGLDVENERVAIQSEQAPEHNAAIVAAAIARSTKPVILITHSKGSLDSLEALITRKDLRAKVKGWASIQGAFLGSPVADFIDGSRALSFEFDLLLRALGGTYQSLVSLTTRDALRRYEKNKAAIAEVTAEVPFVAFASWKDSVPGRANTLMGLSRNIMERGGMRSDGLMPTMNSVLPGTRFIAVPGVDHTGPYMRSFEEFDRVRFTKALLSVLMSSVKIG